MPDLGDHLGSWAGRWRTFLEPGELHDQSPVTATIERDGDDFVVEYRGTIEGAPVTGRLRWSEGAGTTTVDWVDSWHTQGERERLEGSGDAPPSYEYGDADPWTWDISIEADDRGVTVTHHNTGPDVPRYVGVLMTLTDRTG